MDFEKQSTPVSSEASSDEEDGDVEDSLLYRNIRLMLQGVLQDMDQLTKHLSGFDKNISIAAKLLKAIELKSKEL